MGAYVGTELDAFAHATNWKAYVRDLLDAHLRGEVLEVGAGIGATTRALLGERVTRWTCVEPDAELASRIHHPRSIERCEVVVGTIGDVEAGRRFDAVLYVDVLEHVQDDAAELRRAQERLRPGGALVVVSPAHQALYSEFDRAIGHHRRYSRASLRAIAPGGWREEAMRYVDSAGMLASLGNRVLLRSGSPSLGQVRFWDRVLVPLSVRLDRLLGFQVGKSIVAVWVKPGSTGEGARAEEAF